jgi:CHASE3 domain sensor protein
MTAFFVCVVLIGIILVIVSIIWMIIEKKNNRDYRLEIDEKRYELQQLIEDSEQLLNELNNFSGYIVSRMEEKEKDIEEAVKSADERLALLSDVKEIPDNSTPTQSQDTEEIKENSRASEDEFNKALPFKKGKVIPFDVKKREVMKLKRHGMGNAEIAKLLNMGKGEIELIIRTGDGSVS